MLFCGLLHIQSVFQKYTSVKLAKWPTHLEDFERRARSLVTEVKAINLDKADPHIIAWSVRRGQHHVKTALGTDLPLSLSIIPGLKLYTLTPLGENISLKSERASEGGRECKRWNSANYALIYIRIYYMDECLIAREKQRENVKPRRS